MTPLEPGSVFARDYRVVRLMARGGMGAVYEVEQLSTSKTRALKVLHGQLATDAKIRQRFEQEARASARIESDHVVDVVAAGVIEGDGTPWLVMEFLKGVDLAKHLERRGPLPPGEVLEIFRQMGHALAAAHRAGLVHRDLKPENVFLAESRREGASFTVKVLDFGIAKALADAPGRATMAMGTPFWMAPEQTEASNIIQPATDVWAMGLIAYSLLTNACYWRSAAKAEAGVAGVLIEMTTGALDPPSARAREYGRDRLLPPGFDAWFLRCVARTPAERFPSAAECVAALTPVLAGPAGLPLAATTPAFGGPTPTPLQGVPSGAPPPAVPQTAWHGAPVGAGPLLAPAPSAPPAPQSGSVATQRVPAWVILVAVLATIAVCVGVFVAWRLTRLLHRVDGERDHGPTARPTPAPPKPRAPSPGMVPIAPTPDVPAGTGPAEVALVAVRQVTNGGVLGNPPPAVVRSMHRTEPMVLACLRQTAAVGELSAVATFDIRFDVAPTGRAADVSLVGLDSARLNGCVTDGLFHHLFPAGRGATYVSTWVITW